MQRDRERQRRIDTLLLLLLFSSMPLDDGAVTQNLQLNRFKVLYLYINEQKSIEQIHSPKKAQSKSSERERERAREQSDKIFPKHKCTQQRLHTYTQRRASGTERRNERVYNIEFDYFIFYHKRNERFIIIYCRYFTYVTLMVLLFVRWEFFIKKISFARDTQKPLEE